MSDVHTTVTTPPPSAPPPQAAPSQTEVPINQSPTPQQTPLGNQAPPKPEGAVDNKTSAISRREAIQNAFNRAAKDQQDAANKPPAERPRQARTQDKETTQQPQSERQPQHREQGRFARDPSKPQPEQTQQATGQQPQQQQQFRPLDQNAPFRDAPPRFNERAKAEWAGAPESVRGAVHQMAREFQGAYEKYRGDAEVMETLRPWHDLATKQGTTLEKAFSNYWGMEQKIRAQPLVGLEMIVRNLGMKSPTGEPITFRDICHFVANMSPEQYAGMQTQTHMSSSEAQIAVLRQQNQQILQSIGEIQKERRFDAALKQVDTFAETHPRLNELGAAIKQELDHGYSLEVAYARADRLYPPTQAAQTRNTSAQTRRTSISGAPDGTNGKSAVPTTRPSDGRQRTNGEAQHPTRREAIAKAMRRVSNGV